MATPAAGAASLSAGTLTAQERELVARVAACRAQLIELTRELISYDTTTRAYPQEPARQEQALQAALADRLRAVGAAVDVWEPAPEEVVGHPLSGGRTFGCAGRPQLAARVRGSGGGASVLFNGHIDWAHTVGEHVPIADLVNCAQGLAVAAWRLCR